MASTAFGEARARPSHVSVEISVVIVCLNALPALQATLASVRRQQDSRVRVYIIDGASRDGTADYLRAAPEPVTGWLSEPDTGIYDAMNKGWRMVPDDAYVLYLGAGDTVLSLPPTDSLLDGNGEVCPVVLGRCDVGSQPFYSTWGGEMRLRNTAHHQALMVRKTLSVAPPFDQGLRVYGDWDFNLRLLGQGVRARFVPDFHTYAAPGGVSWNHDLREIRQVAQRHGGYVLGVASWLLNRLTVWHNKRAARPQARR